LNKNIDIDKTNKKDKIINMKINRNDIILTPLLDDDVNLFCNWLNKEYIYKWFCPEGNTEKEAWLDEVINKNEKYKHMKHYINNIKIGFCLYMDCYFEQEYIKENYGLNVNENYAYEIGYCIGEEEYLGKGIGKIIIKKLEEEIIKIEGKEIWADPNEKNIISIKTLLNNGFIKIKDGDYRKKLY